MKKKIFQPRSTVLITGASSGIGLAFAEYSRSSIFKKNNQRGENVLVMVARNPQKLKQAVTQLKKKQKGDAPVILSLAIDLSQPGSIDKLMVWVKKKNLQITTLINNAGVGYMGKFIDMTEKKFEEIITLNIFALTSLTHAVLSQVRSSTLPTKENLIIIHVASVVGLLPFPLATVYAASKAYVVSFSEALRIECKKNHRYTHGSGVEIYTLCPGSTRTSFFQRAGSEITPEKPAKKRRGLLGADQFMSPEQVVEETWQAVERKQSFIIPGIANRFIPLLGRLLPRQTALFFTYFFMKKRLK